MNSRLYLARDQSFVAAEITWLPIEYPPSSRICAPVTCAEAEEERNSAIPARSCGIPTRPTKLSECVFPICSEGGNLPVGCLATISSPFWAKPNAVIRDGKTLWMGIVKSGWE